MKAYGGPRFRVDVDGPHKLSRAREKRNILAEFAAAREVLKKHGIRASDLLRELQKEEQEERDEEFRRISLAWFRKEVGRG